MTPSIQSSAEADILLQIEWYAERGLAETARQFLTATRNAIEALSAAPGAGAPRPSTNPRLAGLRTWPVPGFDAFKVYYLVQAEFLLVVRVLHGKRDVDAVLGRQRLERPRQT